MIGCEVKPCKCPSRPMQPAIDHPPSLSPCHHQSVTVTNRGATSRACVGIDVGLKRTKNSLTVAGTRERGAQFGRYRARARHRECGTSRGSHHDALRCGRPTSARSAIRLRRRPDKPSAADAPSPAAQHLKTLAVEQARAAACSRRRCEASRDEIGKEHRDGAPTRSAPPQSMSPRRWRPLRRCRSVHRAQNSVTIERVRGEACLRAD